MKTKAAILREIGKDWEIIELDLDPPKAGEVLVRYAASGLCHSDDHVAKGDGKMGASPTAAGTKGPAWSRRSARACAA